jgi:dihydroneopterin aldolase
MSDSIAITGITATGFHGVYTEERAEGQKFVVDVKLSLNLEKVKDDLSKTVNYADVATLVVRHIKSEPVNLIETVAESIAKDVLKNFPLVEKIKVGYTLGLIISGLSFPCWPFFLLIFFLGLSLTRNFCLDRRKLFLDLFLSKSSCF